MFGQFDKRFLMIGVATLLAQGDGGLVRLAIVAALSAALTYYAGSCP